MKAKIRGLIRREDPTKEIPPRFQTFEVETEEEITPLDFLNAVFHHADPTLAYRRYRCGRRLCRSCEIKLDGKIVRGCAALLRPGKTYVLEPARPQSLIRDLVCDFEEPVNSSEP